MWLLVNVTGLMQTGAMFTDARIKNYINMKVYKSHFSSI